MFQFGAFAPRIAGWHAFSMPGSPIRKSPDRIICADPRGLSQLVASFFASESQGILRVPFLTFFSPYPFASVRGCFSRHRPPRTVPLREPPPADSASDCCLLFNFFLPICQRTFGTQPLRERRFSGGGDRKSVG